METLATIYEQYRHLTDKGTRHSYLPFYEQMLSPFRDRVVTLIELGVHTGGSLMLWRDYLPLANIVGIDVIEPCTGLGDRITCLQANALTVPVMPADIIIDDAGHQDQLTIFRRFYPAVLSGGLYVIEDVQSDADCKVLLAAHPFQMVDLRSVKDTYDDVILWTRKG